MKNRMFAVFMFLTLSSVSIAADNSQYVLFYEAVCGLEQTQTVAKEISKHSFRTINAKIEKILASKNKYIPRRDLPDVLGHPIVDNWREGEDDKDGWCGEQYRHRSTAGVVDRYCNWAYILRVTQASTQNGVRYGVLECR